MSTRQDLCTFHLGPYVFGVDVALVQEVLVQQVVTRVPLAPPSVAGVMNLRGQIVTAIDLRRRLDLEPRAEDATPACIVIRMDADLVAFQVDRAGDVLAVDGDAFERPPDTLRGAAADLITGAYKQPDHLLLVLDAERAAMPPVEAPASALETE